MSTPPRVAQGGCGRTLRPEPPPETEAPPWPGDSQDGGSKGRPNKTASGYRRAEASARAAAFWDRMARCPTVDALHREIMREARQHGAAQSTVEAFMLSLRERGFAALAEPDTERRLLAFSRAQVAGCIDRLDKHRAHYRDADRLIVTLARVLQ